MVKIKIKLLMLAEQVRILLVVKMRRVIQVKVPFLVKSVTALSLYLEISDNQEQSNCSINWQRRNLTEFIGK